MAEETVFQDSNVNITTTRIIISGTTYALRNITSVKMATAPAKLEGAIVLLIVGILGLLGSFGAFSSDPGSAFVGLLFAAAILAGAIFWLRSSKPEYHVAIASSSGEAHALTSKDRSYIEKVVGSINEAITRC